jgi:hypothetical protein
MAWTWQLGVASDALTLTLSVCLGLMVYALCRFMTYRLRAPRIDYLCVLAALMAAGAMFITIELVMWGE